MDQPETSSFVEPNRVRSGLIALHTGVTLSYEEFGDPLGEASVFLHGLGDSWYSFSRVIPLLPSKYHMYAIDQRGHGNSEKPAGGYAPGDMAGDILAFMDALHLTTASLVGHSMASFIAQHIATQASKRITQLVLIASAPSTRGNLALQAFYKEALDLTDPIPRDLVYESICRGMENSCPADFLDGIVSESLKVPARVWRAVVAGLLAEDQPHRLADISAPPLIVWGDHDTLFSHAEQLALAEAIPSTTLIVYDGVGHNTHWERPQQVARDIETFLGGAPRY